MKNLIYFCRCLLLCSMVSCADHHIPQQLSCEEVNSRFSGATWLLTSKKRNDVEVIQNCETKNKLVFGAPKLPTQFALLTTCTDAITGGTWSCTDGAVTLIKGEISQTLTFLSTTSFLLTYKDSNGDSIAETYVKQ